MPLYHAIASRMAFIFSSLYKSWLLSLYEELWPVVRQRGVVCTVFADATPTGWGIATTCQLLSGTFAFPSLLPRRNSSPPALPAAGQGLGCWALTIPWCCRGNHRPFLGCSPVLPPGFCAGRPSATSLRPSIQRTFLPRPAAGSAASSASSPSPSDESDFPLGRLPASIPSTSTRAAASSRHDKIH